MDTQKIKDLFYKLKQMGSANNWSMLQVPPCQITAIKNDLTKISNDISREYPHFCDELFRLKDSSFLYKQSYPHQIHSQPPSLSFLRQMLYSNFSPFRQLYLSRCLSFQVWLSASSHLSAHAVSCKCRSTSYRHTACRRQAECQEVCA